MARTTLSPFEGSVPPIVVVSTSVVALVSGFLLGVYSIRGYLISPSLKNERERYWKDPVESEESDIDEDDTILDHAPNWANGEEADRRQALRAGAAKPTTPAAASQPAEKIKGLVATEDIPAGTEITGDLLKKFEEKELTKEQAATALDPKDQIGKVVRAGLPKGYPLTGTAIGEPGLKPVVQDVADVKAGNPNPTGAPVNAQKKKYRDVAVHTPTGTRVYRYEEVKPGQWRLIGELPAGASATEDTDEQPKSDTNR